MHNAIAYVTEDLLKPKEAAARLGLTVRFLEARRYRGDGPAFVRISPRCVRYRDSDLQEWIEARVRMSTTDNGNEL